jgi:hypothetical protein
MKTLKKIRQIAYLNHHPRGQGGVGVNLPDFCFAVPKIKLHYFFVNFLLAMHLENKNKISTVL